MNICKLFDVKKTFKTEADPSMLPSKGQAALIIGALILMQVVAVSRLVDDNRFDDRSLFSSKETKISSQNMSPK